VEVDIYIDIIFLSKLAAMALISSDKRVVTRYLHMYLSSLQQALHLLLGKSLAKGSKLRGFIVTNINMSLLTPSPGSSELG